MEWQLVWHWLFDCFNTFLKPRYLGYWFALTKERSWLHETDQQVVKRMELSIPPTQQIHDPAFKTFGLGIMTERLRFRESQNLQNWVLSIVVGVEKCLVWKVLYREIGPLSRVVLETNLSERVVIVLLHAMLLALCVTAWWKSIKSALKWSVNFRIGEVWISPAIGPPSSGGCGIQFAWACCYCIACEFNFLVFYCMVTFQQVRPKINN